MTGLNSVVRSLTGPRCLRSALCEKIAPIQRLLKALDGPTELQVRIPASVFGGDIFGVMSQHLREALVCPPPSAPSIVKPRRRQSLPPIENPFAPHPSNPFPPLVNGSRQSTLTSEPIETTRSTVLALDRNSTLQSSAPLPPEPQASREHSVNRNLLSLLAAEKPAAWASGNTDLTELTKEKRIPSAPALIQSLTRYWESICQRREPTHLHPQPLLPDSFANRAAFPLSDTNQRTASRIESTSVGQEVSEKLRAFKTGFKLPLKSACLDPTQDRPVQNVFNIEVNNGNHSGANYDDLGERIAQVLHEQALQHGIDVT